MQIIPCVMQSLTKCLCVLYHAVSPSFALPTPDVFNRSELAPSEPRTKAEAISVKLVNFFNPVTCQPKSNQKVEPCQAGEYTNETLCLQHKCCVSSKKQIQLDCYAPLEDRPQQILRFFAIGIGGVMLIACFPFCCFIVERSPCANPLRRDATEEETDEGDSNESNYGSEETSDSQSVSLVQDDVEKCKTKKKSGN